MARRWRPRPLSTAQWNLYIRLDHVEGRRKKSRSDAATLQIVQCTQIHVRKGGALVHQRSAAEESPVFLATVRHGGAFLGFSLLLAPADDDKLFSLGKEVAELLPAGVKDVFLDFVEADAATLPLKAGLGHSGQLIVSSPTTSPLVAQGRSEEVDGPPLEQALGLALRMHKATGKELRVDQIPWFRPLLFTQPVPDSYDYLGLQASQICLQLEAATLSKKVPTVFRDAAFQSTVFQTVANRLIEWSEKEPRVGYSYRDWFESVRWAAINLGEALEGDYEGRRLRLATAASALFSGYVARCEDREASLRPGTEKQLSFDAFLVEALSAMDERVKDWALLNYLADEAFAAWLDTPDTRSSRYLAQVLSIHVPIASINKVQQCKVQGSLLATSNPIGGVNGLLVGTRFQLAPQECAPPREVAVQLWTQLTKKDVPSLKFPAVDETCVEADSRGLVELHLPLLGNTNGSRVSLSEPLVKPAAAKKALLDAGLPVEKLAVISYRQRFTSQWPWPFGGEV